MEDKMRLPTINAAVAEAHKRTLFKRRLLIVLSFLFCYFSFVTILANHPSLEWPDWNDPTGHHGHGKGNRKGQGKGAPKCEQVPPLHPNEKSVELDALEQYLKTDQFRNESIAKLSGAVRIPTQSFDDMGIIGVDKRWDIFYEFAEYLKTTFPLVHLHLDLDIVNTHGLVYTWKGTNESLKPTLLMAHQDVVPVPDSAGKQWTHPPFGGHYDGKFIWGRGASDCKNSLIAILESLELLIKAGFQPKRTVVLSSGFDEEISGREGAGHLAPWLLEKYGKDSFAVVVDEGAGVNTLWGTHFASPGVAEKGYVDVEIIVRAPGGHSSIPPNHNGIGIMSDLITQIESHLHLPHLSENNPYLAVLQCGAEHSSEFPKKLKKLLPKHSSKRRKCSSKKDELAIEASKEALGIKYLMTTSVAVDLINGGVKVNALPERTTAIVNHRINIGETTKVAKDKMANIAKTITQKYNLTLHAFPPNQTEGETPSSITLIAHSTALEPAPVTPTTLTDSHNNTTPYAILSGTTKALYGDAIVMAPGIMTGNTDTRYYWDLSRHIFRYVPGWDPENEGMGRIHTVDERISVKAHADNVKWFALFVWNMDGAVLG
ncbi:carboxypeptidase s [Tothia fuscella]|uniref:Carboxypeptidase s n=1 Tax=Tothia fuscella TaxID=1048955 RepID=A0A9P4NIG0_9PEZI|nr:carboxypeptidase s [Tothia fuscella]